LYGSDPAGNGSSPGGKIRLPNVIVNFLAASMLITMALYFNAGPLIGQGLALTVLPREERQAMAWVAERAPAEARFAVVSGEPWSTDRSSEWFPVLARRVSVATVQGTEWLPDRAFSRRAEQHRELQQCGSRDVACLHAWSNEHGLTFDWVYVAERGLPWCCGSLRSALERDPRFVQEYAGPGAALFARRSP
jgi:hypothetical protein